MRKILVVDDEKSVRNVFLELLNSLGYNVVLAEDAYIGFEMYKTERPDLTIIDLRLPQKDGLALFRELKEYDPNVKAYATCGYMKDKRMLRLVEEGALGCIPKPLPAPPELSQMIEEGIETRVLSENK